MIIQTSIIGNGVALDVPILFKEVKSIVDRGVPMPKILFLTERRW